VNKDEQPFCTLHMSENDGSCGRATNVWISDDVTAGFQSCVCLLLYCELGQDTWALTHAQYCSLRVKLKFDDPQTLPESTISFLGLPLWDTITFFFITFEIYFLVFPIYRLARWLLSLGDFMKEWGRY